MPEGDTIFRTAETLRRWIGGREITAARSRVYGFPALRLVGMRVDGVDARGKHLLIRLDGGHVLHTHLRMSGSWHVYPEGRPWRRPESQARLVLEAGDRVAVCFHAPIVELLQPNAESAHPLAPAGQRPPQRPCARALGLQAQRPALPQVRHPHRVPPPGRTGPHRLLVPRLPARLI